MTLATNNPFDNFMQSWTPTAILLKVVSRCNLGCTYCYWFRDSEVLQSPIRMPLEIEDSAVEKIAQHITNEKLELFQVTIHGGEPLLFGKKRMRTLLLKLRHVAVKTSCNIKVSIQTNAVLIDDEWAKIFSDFSVGMGVSLDGPKALHNQSRQYINGAGSYDDVMKGIKILQRHRISFGVLGVGNPRSCPKETLKFFFDDLKLRSIDILIPDFNHDDLNVEPIGEYYRQLFNIWLENYAERGFKIRFFDNIIKSLFGIPSSSEAIGYGPQTVVTIHVNGHIEPVDTLRIAGREKVKTGLNVVTDEIRHIRSNSLFRKIVYDSLVLPESCRKCDYALVCGGGYLPHRWSSKNSSYNNPSRYCGDLKLILSHIESKVKNEVKIRYGA